jgi:hypothetical protein
MAFPGILYDRFSFFNGAGWDVFSLRYSVDEPLATVLTDAGAAQIQAVARLLWALKRAEHSLSAAWLLLNTTQRTLSRLTAKAKRAHLPCTGACLPISTTPTLAVLITLLPLKNVAGGLPLCDHWLSPRAGL